jgi:DNA helicase II / ATP-dependent DNA helicase PcrA
MKFPAFSDLDREQKIVYGQAPVDGAILVIGPPGTGKTILAFHRAQKAQKLKQSPSVVMYNKVLKYYTDSREGVAVDVPVATMNSWVWNWWKRTPAEGGRAPQLEKWVFDWEKIEEKITALDPSDPNLSNVNWGHLIIDEGQDFSEEMYFAFGQILRFLSRSGQDARITVFADDNQRLKIDANCSVKDIAKNLRITADDDRVYYLSKNYRNTLEVAKFARYFQVGKTSGAAVLPSRRGELPSVVFLENERELAKFIVRKAKLNPGKQVGVIVQGTNSRVTRLFNDLKPRAAKVDLETQYYVSGIQDKIDFSSLNFITVLNQQSSKGLEFDVVFYIGLEQINFDTTGGLNERMAMYVMASRAREELCLCFVDVSYDAAVPAGLSYLPKPDRKLCRYEAVGSGEGGLTNYLSSVDWIEPDDDAPYWEDVAT